MIEGAAWCDLYPLSLDVAQLYQSFHRCSRSTQTLSTLVPQRSRRALRALRLAAPEAFWSSPSPTSPSWPSPDVTELFSGSPEPRRLHSVRKQMKKEWLKFGSTHWLRKRAVGRPAEDQELCQTTAGRLGNAGPKTRYNHVTRPQKMNLKEACLNDVQANAAHMVERQVLERFGREA